MLRHYDQSIRSSCGFYLYITDICKAYPAYVDDKYFDNHDHDDDTDADTDNDTGDDTDGDINTHTMVWSGYRYLILSSFT